MKRIEGRNDVNMLVKAFYGKIRKDDTLGLIFNAHIEEDQWPAHIEKLTDFWETNLFGIPKFKGNPTQKHIQVDKNINHQVSQIHFGKWLAIWLETIDEHFVGSLADKAKEKARKMATAQYLSIWTSRNLKH